MEDTIPKVYIGPFVAGRFKYAGIQLYTAMQSTTRLRFLARRNPAAIKRARNRREERTYKYRWRLWLKFMDTSAEQQQGFAYD